MKALSLRVISQWLQSKQFYRLKDKKDIVVASDHTSQ